MTRSQLKVAIYTRKSTEHGLEQEFNSLAAQRESAEAYIKSQRSEGWVLVKQTYDDGGISGGTMARPALQRLLSDVEAGQVDIIVVYKVDRLTRSLSDFARIIERLDAAGASFVSVTQQFNTSTSMGRLTLNVLLSFAQFEREVTAERIRDKVDASKKKGIWMGGPVPLGYDNKDKKLVINENEAQVIRAIFKAYLTHSNVQKLCHDINRRGYLSKKRNDGKLGGKPFRRGHLYYILNNPIYRGSIRHKGKCYQGCHDPIIGKALWQKVQDKLQANRIRRPAKSNHGYPSLLAGILIDANGKHFTACHSSKKDKRYRYYNTNPVDDTQAILRYPAQQIEDAVKNALINWLRDDTQHPDTAARYSHRQRRFKSIEDITSGTPHQQKERLHHLLHQVILSDRGLCLLIKPNGTTQSRAKQTDDNSLIRLELEIRFKHGQIGRKIIIPNERQQLQKCDQKLIMLIARAHFWIRDLHSGRFATMTELANKHGINKADLGKNIRLAYLAPDIINAIMEGRQPASLKVSHLRRLSNLPSDWDEQREFLGFI